MEKLLPNFNPPKANSVIPVLDKLIEFSLYSFAAFSMFSISLTQISFALGALSWLLKVQLTHTWKKTRGTLVGFTILSFGLACVLSIITSVDQEHSVKILKKTLQFIIFFWVINSIRDEKQSDFLIKLVVFAGVVSSLYGILPLIMPGFFDEESVYGTSMKRAIGTMGVPATFSGVLMLVGLVALGRFLFHKPKNYWILGCVVVISLCLLLTMTRQTWLGYFIGTIILIYLWNKKWLLIIPILLISILFLSPERVSNRLYSLTDFKDIGLTSRINLWKGGLEIFKDHPITGCGHKCVDSIYSQYSDPSGWVAHYRGMHNNIIQLLVDTGIVGLATWALIWITYFVEIYKRLKAMVYDQVKHSNAGAIIGSATAVLAFLIGGFFETSIYDSEVTMLLYFIMGISLSSTESSFKKNEL